MRLNVCLLVTRRHVSLDNRSRSETNKEKVAHNINGSREGTEIIAANGSTISRVDHLDGSIATTGVKLAIGPHDRSNETGGRIVEVVGIFDLVTSPDVDITSSGTCVGTSLVVGSDSCERGSLVATERTLLLVLTVDIEVLASLDTGTPNEVLVSLVEGEIPDRIRTTLSAPDHFARADIKESDDVIVGSVSSCNSITI